MRHWWERGLLLLCALSLGLLWPPRLSAGGIEDLKKGVVKIVAHVEGQQPKVGTGFVVWAEEEAAYIVTASHVIGSDPQPAVEFFTKPHQSFKAKVIATEGGSDNGLAALIVQMKIPKGTVALGVDVATRLSGGEAVSSIGFPRRREAWAVTSGTISGIKNRHITIQAPIEEGNSGGPLLLNGRVVGVVTQSAGSFGQAEPAATLRLFLHASRVPIEEEGETGVAGREFMEPADEARVGTRSPTGQQGPARASVDVTGTWMVPGEPGYHYVFQQKGQEVTMTQVMADPLLGSQPRVYAEGEIEGRHIEMVYLNASGMGTIVLDVLDDQQSMQGVFNLGMVPLQMFLQKRGD